MDVCMCTHNCMHKFGVSAHCAVDMCVLDMRNTFTKHTIRFIEEVTVTC